MVSKEVFVTKRDGSLVPYNVEKIKQTVEWACEGLEVQHLSLESKFDEFVFNRISTKQIQDNLIHHAKSLASPVESDWVFVAGRLETMNRWAATRSYDIPFLEFFKKQKSLGIWCHPMFDKYSDQDIAELGKEIIKDNDLKHSYASVTTALSKYLLPNECIQHMFMGNAMVIAGVENPEFRLEFAKEVYKALSDRKISLATPWLSNLRNNGNISSCFIIAVDDNIHSIFDNLKKAALISKNGGGLGVSLAKVRCRGSKLMGNEGGSGGVLGWCKLFNDTAVSVNQGGKRAGAFTVELPIWHGDIDEFLDIQTESGDQRKKAYDIKPQVTINDIFMRLKDDGESNWLTFCPYEVKEKLDIELFNCFGDEFEKAYEICVKAANSGVLKVVRRYKAKELFKQIMKVQFETGLPYIAFIDEINRQNPNKHIGNIPCVNLCVAGETKILTDAGYLPIGELAGEKVNVWNGEEWSEVTVVKTGENQELIQVVTDFGHKLDCTPYHKFYVQLDYKGTIVEKRAHELKAGDKLIKFDLPVIEGFKVLNKAYTNGFFSGDGCASNGKGGIYLYHNKRELKEFIEHDGSWCEDDSQNRSVAFVSGLKDKFFVPDASYSVQSRLEWLAGWLDADGVVCSNGANQSLQGASVEGEFLVRVQEMLQTLGVNSKISVMREAGKVSLPRNDGTNGYSDYQCKEVSRLLISSTGLYKLATLGFKTNRLVWEKRLPQRECERFVTIKEVNWNGRVDDTYCFTEPKRHMGMFAGILTGQCTESFSVVISDDLDHTCNLASLVMGRIEVDEIPEYASLATRILDNGISLTSAPTEGSQKHNNLLRTIGVGIQGYADLVAREHKSFLDIEFATKIAEMIAWGCVNESITLAKDRGKYPAYDGSDWDNGVRIDSFAKNSVTSYDWEGVQDKLNQFGIRNSQMTSPAPNTSTSGFMDAAASVMPVYSAFFYEDNRDGLLPVAAMYIKENPLSYARDITRFKPWDVTQVVGAMQKFIDTGISAEYIMDKNQDGFNAKWLWDTIDSAWKNKNKAVYYIRTIKKGEKLVQSESDCAGCAA